jgi:hypothetical protein
VATASTTGAAQRGIFVMSKLPLRCRARPDDLFDFAGDAVTVTILRWAVVGAALRDVSLARLMGWVQFG